MYFQFYVCAMNIYYKFLRVLITTMFVIGEKRKKRIKTGQCWPFPSVLWYLDDGKELSMKSIRISPLSFGSWQGSAMTILVLARHNYPNWEVWKFLNFHDILFLNLNFSHRCSVLSIILKGDSDGEKTVVLCHHWILYKLGDTILGEYMLYNWIKFSKKKITKKSVYTLEQYYRTN